MIHMTDSEGEYRGLGRQLKHLRTRAKESLAEVSGAVEIDVRQLASFELGQSRPSEDVLLLLISHFGAKDEEAVKMWEMAGYVSDNRSDQKSIDEVAPRVDNQILFTDVVDITVNNYGVVMNFMQGTGPNSAPNSVSRVGMSREHAKSVLQILQMTLSQTERGQKDLNKTTNSENKTT
jgi:transcriptional regulator with XRE-family HTH domain